MINIKSLNTVEVPAFMDDPMSTGIKCLDELFGGDGIIRSQVVTLDAYRGSGKTTMLLQMLDSMTVHNFDARSLYVSREEPDFQLRKTSRRLGLNSGLNVVGDEEDVYLDDIVFLMDHYDIIVVDSYSCLKPREGRLSDEGKMDILKKAAKSKECAIILVLHQTKSGSEKGGSSVGHMGDTCISISKGDIESFGEDVRILEVTKNRFGGCGKTLLRIGRNGYDFNPIEETVNNDYNKGENMSAQKKRPFERKAILKLMSELEEKDEYLTLDTLSLCVEEEDDAAFGRHERHLKHMDMNGGSGHVMKIGRGSKAHWELTDKGRESLKA